MVLLKPVLITWYTSHSYYDTNNAARPTGVAHQLDFTVGRRVLKVLLSSVTTMLCLYVCFFAHECVWVSTSACGTSLQYVLVAYTLCVRVCLCVCVCVTSVVYKPENERIAGWLADRPTWPASPVSTQERWLARFICERQVHSLLTGRQCVKYCSIARII